MKLQEIKNSIYVIRGQSVMLDFDLAKLYEVETRVLKQAVRRNSERFPEDFMFVLTKDEMELMVSQNVIPSIQNFGGAKPFAFTEQGVAMLSSVLRSKKAIQINISLMRAFIELRQFALTHKELASKLVDLESKYNKQFKDVFEALNYLLKNDKKELKQKQRKPIGYK